MHVAVQLEAPLDHLCSFVRWLRKHSQLIKSIAARTEYYNLPSKIQQVPSESYVELAQLLLQPALQFAGAWAATEAQQLAAAAAVTELPKARGAVLQQRRQQLQLSSFSSDWLCTPAMLAGLPAHSLTHLSISPPLRSQWTNLHEPGFTAAFKQLSSLQELHVTHGTTTFLSSCLASIPCMSQLTLLHVQGHIDVTSKQQLQQLLAQPLPLRRLLLDVDQLPVLNMAALTSLEEFFSYDEGFAHDSKIPTGSVLPAQLQRLSLDSGRAPRSLQLVTGLQQLQHLSISYESADHEPLLHLAQLPALQHLKLDVFSHAAAAGTAPAWPLLPQLQELTVRYIDVPDRQQWTAIAAGVAACTGLTKLDLQASMLKQPAPGAVVEEDEEAPVAVCASLAGLTRLRDLSFYPSSSLVPGDILALTVLTGLTRLLLNDLDGVSDLAATALACSLRQLRHLELDYCSLGDMVCLAAIAQLTQLTELSMYGKIRLKEHGLMLLTGLKQLQKLHVCTNESVTQEALGRFWKAVRQQQS
jgi:hypothetical protein